MRLLLTSLICLPLTLAPASAALVVSAAAGPGYDVGASDSLQLFVPMDSVVEFTFWADTGGIGDCTDVANGCLWGFGVNSQVFGTEIYGYIGGGVWAEYIDGEWIEGNNVDAEGCWSGPCTFELWAGTYDFRVTVWAQASAPDPVSIWAKARLNVIEGQVEVVPEPGTFLLVLPVLLAAVRYGRSRGR